MKTQKNKEGKYKEQKLGNIDNRKMIYLGRRYIQKYNPLRNVQQLLNL